MNDYISQFHDYPRRAVQAALRRLNPEPDAPLKEREKLRALQALNYALTHDESWPDSWHLLDRLAPRMEQAGHRDDWVPTLEQGIEHCKAMNDLAAEAAIHIHLGYLNMLMNRYQEAQRSYRQGLVLYKSCQNYQGEGIALNRLAMLNLRQRHDNEAIDSASRALNKLARNNSERANSFYVIGMVNKLNQRAEPAIEALQKSLDLWRRSGSKRRTAWGVLNLGAALRVADRADEANRCYQEARRTFLELNDILWAAITQMNLGVLYSQVGNHKGALECYHLSLNEFKSINDRYHIAVATKNSGIDFRYIKEYGQSEAALLSSLKLWKELGNQFEICDSTFELWLTYRDSEKNLQAESTLDELNTMLHGLSNEAKPEEWVQSIFLEIQKIQEDPTATDPLVSMD